MNTLTIHRCLVAILGCYLSFVAPAWSHGADDRYSDSIELAVDPDDVYELCLVLTPDQLLRYAFSASGKLGFNVHYHENHEIRYPVAEHQTSAAEATFAPESEQEYCLMWTNYGAAEVELSLQYEMGRQ